MDKYEIRKRKIGLSIIIILLVTFFTYFITINFIVSLAKGFDEIMLGIPLIIIIIIIPILLIVWICNFIRSKNKVMFGSDLKSIGISLIKFTIAILIIGYFVYQCSYTRYGGTIYVDSKFKENSSYYLVIDKDLRYQGEELEVRCSEDIYNLVRVNETYMMDYQISSFNLGRGQLLEIRITN